MSTTAPAARCFATNKFPARLAAVLAFAFAFAPAPARAQAGEETGTVPALMQEAEKNYSDFQCDKAEATLARVKTLLAATEKRRALSAEEDAAWLRGNEIAANCRLNAGDIAGVKAALADNLARNPAYALPSGSGTKLRRALDDLRGRSVGQLRVESTPPGAAVLYAGHRIGATPVDTALPPGPVKFKLKLDGFADADLEGAAVVGSRQTLAVRLVPTGRVLVVFTRPEGIEVTVDGQAAGRTALVKYAPEVSGFLAAKGFDPATVASLDLPALAAGEHLITLSRPCYAGDPLKVPVELDPVNFSKLYLPPQELKSVRGGLAVESTPSGAQVLLDGKEVGVTPFNADDMCGGEHEMKVRLAGRGVWNGRVAIANGERASRSVTLRPALLYLGFYAGDDPPDAESAKREFTLRRALPDLKRYQPVAPGGAELRAKYSPVAAILGRAEAGAPLEDPALADAASAADAELVAVYIPGANPGLKLWSAAGKRVDFMPDSGRGALAALDGDGLGVPVWLGLTLAEVEGSEGLVVGDAGGADPNLLQSGDRITKAGGQKLASLADLRKALEGKSPGDTVALTRARGAVEGIVQLGLRRLLRHLPPGGGDWPAGKLAIDFAAAEADPDPAVAGVARMNRALLAWRSGKAAEALDLLNATAMPRRRGISRGTLDFLIGQLQSQRGEKESARASFNRALSDDGATWLSDDGPPVAPAARSALAALR